MSTFIDRYEVPSALAGRTDLTADMIADLLARLTTDPSPDVRAELAKCGPPRGSRCAGSC